MLLLVFLLLSNTFLSLSHSLKESISHISSISNEYTVCSKTNYYRLIIEIYVTKREANEINEMHQTMYFFNFIVIVDGFVYVRVMSYAMKTTMIEYIFQSKTWFIG